jgi:hypothetical protein
VLPALSAAIARNISGLCTSFLPDVVQVTDEVFDLNSISTAMACPYRL